MPLVHVPLPQNRIPGAGLRRRRYLGEPSRLRAGDLSRLSPNPSRKIRLRGPFWKRRSIGPISWRPHPLVACLVGNGIKPTTAPPHPGYCSVAPSGRRPCSEVTKPSYRSPSKFHFPALAKEERQSITLAISLFTMLQLTSLATCRRIFIAKFWLHQLSQPAAHRADAALAWLNGATIANISATKATAFILPSIEIKT